MIAWHIEQRRVEDLVPADYNPRKISPKEREDIRASLSEFGRVLPVAVNIGSRANVIIGGHQRVDIYREDGIEEIDVMVPDRELTLDEEKELNLRLNRNQATFDYEKLGTNFDLDTLLKVGFGDEELSTMWDDVDLIDDVGRTGEGGGKDPVDVRLEQGDVYACGDHRVMLGNPVKEADVAKLMVGELADMVYCDPPVAVGTREDHEGYIAITLELALKHSKKDVHVFYWAEEKYIGMMQWLYEQASVMPQRVCIWIRNDFAASPKIAFNRIFESCVYGTRGKPWLDKKHAKMNQILNPSVESGNQVSDEILDMMNIWLVKKAYTSDYADAKGKPINLHQKPLRRCTAAGHTVLDLFGGTGSTLMACDQMQRKAFVMESDPENAEKILRRWEENTGKKATRIV